MSSSFIDPAAGTRKNIRLILVLIIVVLVVWCVRPTETSEAIGGLGGFIRENLYVLAAAIGGYYFGRWLYITYFETYVILQVEDPEHNLQSEYILSDGFFQSLKVSEGIANPVSTPSGLVLYRCLDFDPAEKAVRFGFCHDPKHDISHVLLVRERWEDLIRHDHDASLRVRELEVLRYREVMRDGSDLANDLLDSLMLPSYDEQLSSGSRGAPEGPVPVQSADAVGEEV